MTNLCNDLQSVIDGFTILSTLRMYGAIPWKLTKAFTRNLLKYPIGVVITTNRKYLIICKMNT